MKSNVFDIQTKLPQKAVAQYDSASDSVLKLEDWHSFDVELVSKVLLCNLIEKLRLCNRFIDKFFFVREPKNFMFVVHSSLNNKELQEKIKSLEKFFTQKITVSNHKEDREKFESEDVFEVFANIMCETTKLIYQKLKSKNEEFSVYRFLERTQHCMFNMMTAYGTVKNENYFLLQRIAERTSENFDDDFSEFHDNKQVIYKKYY
mgnify:CR=1 FL=1